MGEHEQLVVEPIASDDGDAPKPAGGQEMLDSAKYEISVEVRARNVDAIGYAIPVHWDGKWSGKAAMWDHLRVGPLRKVTTSRLAVS